MDRAFEDALRLMFYGDGGDFLSIVDEDGLRKACITTRQTKSDGEEEDWTVTINRRLLNRWLRREQ